MEVEIPLNHPGVSLYESMKTEILDTERLPFSIMKYVHSKGEEEK